MSFRSLVNDAASLGFSAQDAIKNAVRVRDDWSPAARAASAASRAMHKTAQAHHINQAANIDDHPGGGSQNARRQVAAHYKAAKLHGLASGASTNYHAYTEHTGELDEHVAKAGIKHAPGYSPGGDFNQRVGLLKFRQNSAAARLASGRRAKL